MYFEKQQLVIIQIEQGYSGLSHKLAILSVLNTLPLK